MIQFISMWGGFAGAILSVVAVIILFVVLLHIKNILNKDQILFDQNFALKKQALEQAMNLADTVDENPGIIALPEFKKQAKMCYNQLMCVTTNFDIINKFEKLVLSGVPVQPGDVKKFKCAVRKDIGLKTKKFKLSKADYAREEVKTQNEEPEQPQFNQPAQPPVQPIQQQPIQPQQPMQARPMQRPDHQGVRQVGRPPMPRPQQQGPIQNPMRQVSNQPLRKTDHT